MARIPLSADPYSAKLAAERHVPPPSGLPGTDSHCLVIAPYGAGKTILLKSLCDKWGRSEELLPVYADLQPGLAAAAGELQNASVDSLSPRDQDMIECMTLALDLVLLQRVSRSAGQQLGWSTTGTFRVIAAKDNAWVMSARDHLRDALRRGTRPGMEVPSVYEMANALGEWVGDTQERSLILLVDQVDQVPPAAFPAVTSLLRRTAYFTAVLATRPCPTAPHEIAMAADVTMGDYKVLAIARLANLKARQTLLESVIKKLPFPPGVTPELVAGCHSLSALTWPSLRNAIDICLRFAEFRETYDERTSWIYAIGHVGKHTQDYVRDYLRAWCNPSTVLTRWKRDLEGAEKKRGALSRLRYKVHSGQLFELPSGSDEFLRMAIKGNILLPQNPEEDLLDTVPREFEVAPIVLNPDIDRWPLSRKENVVTKELDKTDLQQWVTRFSRRSPRTKSIFVSYWMSDPEPDRVPLPDILRTVLEDTVAVVDGGLSGSPMYSNQILKKMQDCDAVVSDLTVPRRDIFVEYGWAIGKTLPVVQVARVPSTEGLRMVAPNRPAHPKWLEAFQFQFYGSESAEKELLGSLYELLNEGPDREASWRLGPDASDLQLASNPQVVTFIGNARLVQDAQQECDALLAEADVERRWRPYEDSTATLFKAIRETRECGTLVLLMNLTADDYLCCLAGGLHTTRSRTRMHKKSFNRELLIVDASESGGAVIPGLLGTNSMSTRVENWKELKTALARRIESINEWRRR